jgi:[protein-PII] uridylyltransferase
LTICTWDRVGLFTKIVGSLSAAGLNILSAEIYTRTDGIILDTFFVTDAKTGLLATRESKEEFERLLKAALTGNVNLTALIARQKLARPAYRLAEDERIPTLITFDNDTSDYYSVIEIETEDRVGLLYVISHTLSDLHLDIALAKISTEKGAAIDSFYITDESDHKVTATEYQHFIEDQLRAAIESLDTA